jgi:hypothetical protein
MTPWLITIWTEMILGNFSFAILIVGTLQLIAMIRNRPRHPKILKIDSFYIDPLNVKQVRVFDDNTRPEGDRYYVEIVLKKTDKCEEESLLVYGCNSFNKAVRKFRKVYKKIYRYY